MPKKMKINKKDQVLVTDENISSIFNDTVYPLLMHAEDIDEALAVMKSILEQYKFKSDEMKAKILVPFIDTLILNTRKLLNAEELSQEVKNQIGWYNIQLWFNDGAFIPMKLINYADLLNVKSKKIWEESTLLEAPVFEWAKKEAQLLLDEMKEDNNEYEQDQIDHLKSIVNGEAPFNLVLQELQELQEQKED